MHPLVHSYLLSISRGNFYSAGGGGGGEGEGEGIFWHSSFPTLRSVPVAQRSYALGLQMDLVRVLGAIPGPIVMGRLIDKSCILWNTR